MKKFKQYMQNQRGSVLSVSLIVIALLSFSLSIITNDTLNLAGQTTETQNRIQDTSKYKKILDIALDQMKAYIQSSSSSNPVSAYFNDVYVERDIDGNIVLDASGNQIEYTSKSAEIENKLGVFSEDTTLENGLDPAEIAAIKLSYTIEENVTITRTTYYSFSTETVTQLTGSEAIAQIIDDFNGSYTYEINFYFSMVTNGDLVMNGGYYDIPAILASNIYMLNVAPYELNDQYYFTPSSYGSDPLYKGNNETKIFYDQEYQYCLEGTAGEAGGCIDLPNTVDNPTNNFIINKASYSNVEGSAYTNSGDPQDYKLDEFFSSFDFNYEFLKFIKYYAPTPLNGVINPLDVLINPSDGSISNPLTFNNYEGVIMSNSVPFGNTGYQDSPFVEITNDLAAFLSTSTSQKDFSVVYDARTTPLILSDPIKFQSYDGTANTDTYYDETAPDGVSLDTPRERFTLIVLGDLIIDGAAAATINDLTLNGDLVVTGNLTIRGSADISLTNSIITLGDVIFDFDPGYGLNMNTPANENNANFSGLVLLAKGNVLFNSFYESALYNPIISEEVNLYAFIYSEESVFIDAVKSHVRFSGSIYARARGVIPSDRFLPYVDDEGNQIHGIIINSFNGYITDTGALNYNALDTSNTYNDYYRRFHMTNVPDGSNQQQLLKLKSKFSGLPSFEVKVRSDDYFVDDGYELE